MLFKKTIAALISAIFLFAAMGIPASAETLQPVIGEEFDFPYSIAQNPTAVLGISDREATCVSSTYGTSAVSISVTNTLQKYSGILWIWENVSGTSRSETVNSNSIFLSSTHSNLDSGTYRLKSVFTLTNAKGQIETITVYSSEEIIS